MSVETDSDVGLEEKVQRTLSWYRVPLMAMATFGLVGFVHEIRFFWYGVPIAILGELIQMWAASHLHKDTHLAASGPYSHVRNPMYIGRFVLGLGFFVMTANPYLIGGYVVLFSIYASRRVAGEEERLRGYLGEDYRHYCSETRRWLPKLRPYSRSESRGASWAQLCKNHEQLNMIGLLIVLAAVYLRIERLGHLFWSF